MFAVSSDWQITVVCDGQDAFSFLVAVVLWTVGLSLAGRLGLGLFCQLMLAVMRSPLQRLMVQREVMGHEWIPRMPLASTPHPSPIPVASLP
jgi:hypothetical protein